MKMKTIVPTELQQKFRRDVVELIKQYDLTPEAILALSAYLVGQLIAMQDQTKMTPDMAMEIVAKNIEIGNSHVVFELLESKGKA